MKKFISFIIFLFSIFFIGNASVHAANNPYLISAHDISPDTYVIGTHMFDENRTYLSTEDMMWAARTIEDAESKEDMVVYYKNYNGEWQNGRTGENITVPSTFKIEEYNGEKAKAVLISTVLEEVEYEGGVTGSRSINENDYYEMGLFLKKEKNVSEYNYEILFNAHNIEDGNYDFDIKCSNILGTESEVEYSIGQMPDSVSISNGTFRLPVVIDTTNLGYAFCSMELKNEKEEISSFLSIYSADAEPTLNANAISLEKHLDDGGYGFHTMFAEYPGRFYDIYRSDIETNYFELSFLTRFIEYGSYNLEIIATKDGEEINVTYNDVINIGDGSDSIFGYSNAKTGLEFDEPLSVGEYEFDIILTDADNEWVTTACVYLSITDETSMEISNEVWEEPEVYYSLEELVFDNSKKRKFNMDIFTENIPLGKYAVKAKLDYAEHMAIPVNFTLKYNQNVEIIKPGDVEYFDFAFEIPKTTKVGDQIVKVGHGKYYVELTLHELVEDADGYIFASDVPIARTGFYFTINNHIDGLYGDINGDGQVLNDDTILLKQALAGMRELTYEQWDAANVNQDNSIDSVDVHIIRRHIADNITLPYDSGDKYPINYYLDGGTFEGYYDTVYADISFSTTLTNPVKEGYKFIGWTGSTINSVDPQINVTIPEGTTGPLYFYAHWELAE